MRFFASNINNTWIGTIPEPTKPVKILESGIDYDPKSFFTYHIYKASDYSEYITGLDKDYLCLFSSDHDPEGTYWATFTNKDWSDWQVKGKCFNVNASNESPTINIINGKLHFYEHPVTMPQQTDLHVAEIKPISLTNININSNWTFYNNPLGLHTLANGNQLDGVDESHTGYMSHLSENPDGVNWTNYRTGNVFKYRCSHQAVITAGAELNRPRLSYTTDGITFERGENLFPLVLFPNNIYRSTRINEHTVNTPSYKWSKIYDYNVVNGPPSVNIPKGVAPGTSDRARVVLVQDHSGIGYENTGGRRFLRYAWQDTYQVEYRNFLTHVYDDDPYTIHFYLVNHREVKGDVYYATWDIHFLYTATPEQIERLGDDILNYIPMEDL